MRTHPHSVQSVYLSYLIINTETKPIRNQYETNTLVPLAHSMGENLFYGKLEGSSQKCSSLVLAVRRAYTREGGRYVVAIYVAWGAATITDWILGT